MFDDVCRETNIRDQTICIGANIWIVVVLIADSCLICKAEAWVRPSVTAVRCFLGARLLLLLSTFAVVAVNGVFFLTLALHYDNAPWIPTRFWTDCTYTLNWHSLASTLFNVASIFYTALRVLSACTMTFPRRRCTLPRTCDSSHSQEVRYRGRAGAASGSITSPSTDGGLSAPMLPSSSDTDVNTAVAPTSNWQELNEAALQTASPGVQHTQAKLSELHALFDQGLIDQEDFTRKKNEVLARI